VTIGVFIVFGVLGALSVAMGGGFIVTILWGLLGLVCAVFYLAVTVGAILLLIKAFQGQTFKLPVIGNMAEKFASK
jgi:uncharacterized membrane protein